MECFVKISEAILRSTIEVKWMTGKLWLSGDIIAGNLVQNATLSKLDKYKAGWNADSF